MFAQSNRSEHVSWLTRLKYGAGGILDQWGIFGTKSTANVVFNVILGVNPATIGIVLAVARLWDAFADPFIGSVSDNTQSRWGRRKPFIVVGAILCGITFPLVWMMPDKLSANGQFLWLMVGMLLFYTCFSVFTIPYHALGYEIAPGHHEKTSLLAVRTVIAQIVSIAMAWTFPILQAGWLGNPIQSVHRLGWIVGGVIMISGLVPGLFMPVQKSPPVRKTEKSPLLKNIQIAVRSSLLLRVIGLTATTLVGLNMVNLLGNYITIYYSYHGDLKASAALIAVTGSLWAFLSMIMSPVVAWLSKKLGKRNAFMLLLSLALLATISKWWLFNPYLPYLQLGTIILITPGTVALWMISESMIADVSEYEQMRSGKRLEGVYASIYAWVLKGGIAIALLIANMILVFTGFEVELGANQNPHTLLTLRLLFSFIPAIAIIVSLYLLKGYPLDEKVMNDVQAQLRPKELSNS